jgi:hypothetical protein
MRYDMIRETANANVELLFTFWGIKYSKVTPTELDFISPFRQDSSFGACRYNIKKARGADFAGTGIGQDDFNNLQGLDKSDFAGISGENNRLGFDIISLCMRINKLGSYEEGAKRVASDLNKIKNNPDFTAITEEYIRAKKAQNEHDKAQRIRIADKMWSMAYPLKGTVGEAYLNSRAIFLENNHKNIKFHPRAINKELGKELPILMFVVTEVPGSELKAIHRIYLKEDGSGKADVNNPKMALGDIVGSAIWFGRPGPLLCIAEGPENALSILSLGYDFVCSTIVANNFPNVQIPKYVKQVILFPDNDKAGRTNATKAKARIKAMGLDVAVIYPKEGDFNDLLVKAHNGR